MVQQPPRLEVASGPFKHLGPGVQLRLWLWIAVVLLSTCHVTMNIYHILMLCV